MISLAHNLLLYLPFLTNVNKSFDMTVKAQFLLIEASVQVGFGNHMVVKT